MEDKRMDLDKWSQQEAKAKKTIPYLELLDIGDMNLTSKVIYSLPQPKTKSLSVYVRNNSSLFKVREIEFNLEVINFILDTCGKVKINLNNEEKIVSNILEVLNIYGYNDNDSNSSNNDSIRSDEHSTTNTEELECIFN